MDTIGGGGEQERKKDGEKTYQTTHQGIFMCWMSTEAESKLAQADM
jgi:hypothetical protein